MQSPRPWKLRTACAFRARCCSHPGSRFARIAHTAPRLQVPQNLSELERRRGRVFLRPGVFSGVPSDRQVTAVSLGTMDDRFLWRNSSEEPSVALKRRASDMLTVASCKSLDSSGAELSATNSSAASAMNMLPACDAAPLLIPTPSIPTSSDQVDGRCEDPCAFTSAEVLSIIKAEKLVGQLRLRFECQPDR